VKQELSAVIHNINEELFKEFISSEEKEDYRFKSIMDNIEYLNSPKNDIELLNKYKDLIKDKYKIQEHNKVIRALRSNDVIQDRLDVANMAAYNVKVMYNDIHKMKKS
jgi:predicted Zn-dependent peptidase